MATREAFEDVCLLSRAEHDRLWASGTAPALDSLAGYEFEGWNASLAPKLGGFQKFVKGFLDGEGYNSPVVQNGLDGEWLGLPADDDARRFGFYRVTTTPRGEVLLDYGAHPANPRLDPSRLLRDVLVEVERDPDLLLGRAHLALGRWIFAGYFALRRRRAI